MRKTQSLLETIMRTKAILFHTAIAAGLLISTSAAAQAAQPQEMSSPWSFSASIGTDIAVGGEVMNAGNSNALNLATLNSNLSGTGVLMMRGRDYKDMYEPGAKAAVEVRYAISELSEYFGSVSYMRAAGKNNIDVGCIASVALACNTRLLGSVSDLQETAVELGYRHWLGTGFISEAIRPYFAIRGGAAWSKGGHNYLHTATDSLAMWRLYDDSVVYAAQFDIGATYTISRNAELAAEIGVRYSSDRDGLDTDYGAIGLAAINNNSSRVSIPMSVKLNAVF
ncbi:MAG: hypothetical protein AAB680_04995 [Pseudomonadota bacterium]